MNKIVGNWNIIVHKTCFPLGFNTFKQEILNRIPAYYGRIASENNLTDYFRTLHPGVEKTVRDLIKLEKGKSVWPLIIHIDSAWDRKENKGYLMEVDGDVGGLSIIWTLFPDKRPEIINALGNIPIYLPTKQEKKYSTDVRLFNQLVTEYKKNNSLNGDGKNILWRYTMTLDSVDQPLIDETIKAINAGIIVAPNPVLLSKVWLHKIKTLRDFVPETKWLPLIDAKERKDFLDLPKSEREKYIIKANGYGGGRNSGGAEQINMARLNELLLFPQGKGYCLQKKIDNTVDGGKDREIFMTFAVLMPDNAYKEIGTVKIKRESIRVHGGGDSTLFLEEKDYFKFEKDK